MTELGKISPNMGAQILWSVVKYTGDGNNLDAATDLNK
jgi:hypothetical protein